MKVLLLTDDLGNGGLERQLALLAKTLPAQWDRRVFSLQDGPFAAVLRDADVPVDIHPRASRLDVRPALRLWQVLHRWRPDIVHSWGWMCSLAAGPACRALGIPMIDGTIREGQPRRMTRVKGRPGMWFARRVVANSHAGLRACGIRGPKGLVVWNGFDTARLVLCDAPQDRGESPFTVVMTGRMTPAQGLPIVHCCSADPHATRREALALHGGRRRQRSSPTCSRSVGTHRVGRRSIR